MADLELIHNNATHVGLNCESWLISEMDDVFTFYVPGYKFMPKYKAGIWDGKIRLIDRRTMTTFVGLIPEIHKFCKDRGYTVSGDSKIKACFSSGVTIDDLKSFYRESNLPFPPRSYQHEAVQQALQNQRQTILSATGSGKSYIIYLITKFLTENGLKGLILVPTVSLVEQMYTDFQEYSSQNQWPVDGFVHRIYSGKEKSSDEHSVYVSTWQSVYKQKKDYFEQFDFVIGDEVHLFEANSCNKIMQACTNAYFRIGLTGTIEDAKTSELTLTGLFGPIKKCSSTKELIDKKVLADLDIKPVIMKHNRKKYLDNRVDQKYQSEVDYVLKSEQRKDFIQKMCNNASGNTLVLFNFVDKHGKPQYEQIKDQCPEKEVFFIHGGVGADERERIRKLCEERRNIVVVASYGVFSTGVNIVNIDNVLFTSPTKSKIRVLQSLGRGVRRGSTKTKCILYDMVDDLSGNTKQTSYSMDHFLKRLELYQKEGFNVEMKTVTLNDNV